MDQLFIYLILGVIALLFGFFLGNFFARLKNKSETSKLEERLMQSNLQQEKLEISYKTDLEEREIKKLQQDQKFDTIVKELNLEKEKIRNEKETLHIELTRKMSDFENLSNKLKEQKVDVERLQEKFTETFDNLAQKILETKSEKFTKQNKENIDGILKPLQEKIEKFEARVNSTNKENFGLHSELKEQIKNLSDLNKKISTEATNLTKALKGDTKIQGNWGEMILTRVLEKSGLEKDREYTLQDSHKSDDGKRLQTDVLIHLPDSKKMVVDSKVSLVDFERFVSETDEDLKLVHLKNHINSIKRHVLQLSEKKYHYLIDESPDTVFMFVPIEPAFALAAAHQPNLYEEAFNRQVIIVTPSTLFAALRLVENLWQNDKQKKNALDIATQAGKLYDTFVNLLDELEKIQRQMGTVQGSFDSALIKLKGKGNLIRRVEKLNQLGAITSKKIDQKLLGNTIDDED